MMPMSRAPACMPRLRPLPKAPGAGRSWCAWPLLFTQLGTTLSTIAALQALDAGTAAGDTQAADLSTL